MDKNIIKENLISIILPTYNGERYIKKAIDSVLAQNYSEWELIIVDDGSVDKTENIVIEYTKKDPRILYFKNSLNLGVQKTLNRGLKEANGNYIARLDDDDEWIDVYKLQKQLAFLKTNPEYVLVGTGVIVVDEKGMELLRYLLPEKDSDIRKKILSKNCFIHSSVMYKREVSLSFGGYNELECSKHIEDYYLWLDIGIRGKFYNLPIYSVKYLLREGSISSINKLEQFKKNLGLIKKFKSYYPNHYFAILRSYVRIVVYGFILKLPIKFFMNKIIKIYKENW